MAANYNVFGQATITTPAATADKPTIESNLRLPGQYEDAETGLYYNFNRYHDPQTGRYITQDPIGLVGGLNRFAYADANPFRESLDRFRSVMDIVQERDCGVSLFPSLGVAAVSVPPDVNLLDVFGFVKDELQSGFFTEITANRQLGGVQKT